MSGKSFHTFEKADVFHLYEDGVPAVGTLASASSRVHCDDSTFLSEAQYSALVRTVAARLYLTADEAQQLFPALKLSDPNRFHPTHQGAPKAAEHEPADAHHHDRSASSDATNSTPRLPPFCAHLSREGVEAYWAAPAANAIPDVRCCDARELDRQDPFPAPGHGPHVHCLHCFHEVVDNYFPIARGIPPPLVADFRDADTLQDHQQVHHAQYHAHLRLLDEGDEAAARLTEVQRSAYEAEAEEESRHGCYMASMGTAACPIVVFYCADCDTFAPLVRFQRIPVETEENDAKAWTSTEEATVVLSRLLLCCHVLSMLNPSRFSPREKMARNAANADGMVAEAAARQPRHLIFLFKPILFRMDGDEEYLIDQFEEDAACTYAAAVLPHASVLGSPPQLVLVDSDSDEEETRRAAGDGTEDDDASSASSLEQQFCPVVMGFAMEWTSEELVQAKISLVLDHYADRESSDASSARTAAPADDNKMKSYLPFRVTARWIYIEDIQEWAVAHVLYHRLVAQKTALPRSYVDETDAGIRVLSTYAISAPMPRLAPSEVAAGPLLSSPFRACVSERTAAAHENVSEMHDGAAEKEGEEPLDPLALDGCPYSMESRTIDFFARMTALAKAMHELSVWRLSYDENKD